MSIRKTSLAGGASAACVLGFVYLVAGGSGASYSVTTADAEYKAVVHAKDSSFRGDSEVGFGATKGNSMRGDEGNALGAGDDNELQGGTHSGFGAGKGNRMGGSQDFALKDAVIMQGANGDDRSLSVIAVQGSLSDFNGERLIQLSDRLWFIDRETAPSMVEISDDGRSLTAYNSDGVSVAKMRDGTGNAFLQVVSDVATARMSRSISGLAGGGEGGPIIPQECEELSGWRLCYCLASVTCEDSGGICSWDYDGNGEGKCSFECCSGSGGGS